MPIENDILKDINDTRTKLVEDELTLLLIMPITKSSMKNRWSSTADCQAMSITPEKSD